MKRLFHSWLTILILFVLGLIYLYDFIGPDNVLDTFVQKGWNTQFLDNLTIHVFEVYFPLAYSAIIASDYIRDHKNRMGCIKKATVANRTAVFFGRICAYVFLGFAITFFAMYGGLAVYCFRSGFSFPEEYGFISVCARLFVHYLAFSIPMTAFYTAFAVFFTALFKSGLAGILSSIAFTLGGRLFDYHAKGLVSSVLEIYSPFVMYFYPLHGAPEVIGAYLYVQNHPVEMETTAFGFEHVALALLIVMTCTIALLLASYHLEKRFE